MKDKRKTDKYINYQKQYYQNNKEQYKNNNENNEKMKEYRKIQICCILCKKEI